MQILDVIDGSGRAIEQFDSVLARHLGGVRFRGDGAWSFLSVGAGGHLGRHAAVLDQLFVVIEGSGWVAGGDGQRTPIHTGQAAQWRAGEEHESGSDAGMRVAVLEAPSIEVR